MTVGMLRDAGAEVEEQGSTAARPDSWRVYPGPLRPGTVWVEPDLSNAAPFLAGRRAGHRGYGDDSNT